jgi:23S rRNA pseudouridine2605 synthase
VAEERLQRALARAGLGSRRSCEELIRDGRITVNGVRATLGDRVDPTRDRVEVDGSVLVVDPGARYYALNKPVGVVTTLADPQGRRDLAGFLPEGPRVVPVGRLDRDTEGLLLLTNDG